MCYRLGRAVTGPIGLGGEACRVGRIEGLKVGKVVKEHVMLLTIATTGMLLVPTVMSAAREVHAGNLWQR